MRGNEGMGGRKEVKGGKEVCDIEKNGKVTSGKVGGAAKQGEGGR